MASMILDNRVLLLQYSASCIFISEMFCTMPQAFSGLPKGSKVTVVMVTVHQLRRSMLLKDACAVFSPASIRRYIS